jgi:NADH-ubiquinone oxidoreductase chain 2
MGFILLALAINTPEGIEAYLFYLVQYVLTSINIFFVLLAFSNHPYESDYASPSSTELSKKTQILYISHISRNSNILSNPALALTFAITLFSMAGIPPMIGFFAKLMVIYSATHSGYLFLAIIAILVSVLSAAYYLRVIRVIFFDTSQFTENPAWWVRPNENNSMIIGTLTLLILLFIANPLPILNCLHLLALSLFYW